MQNTHKSLQNYWRQRRGERGSRKDSTEKQVRYYEGLQMGTGNGGEEWIDICWLIALGGTPRKINCWVCGVTINY